MKKILNCILSVVLPFLTFSALLLILHVFEPVVKHPLDIFLGVTAINASSIVGYWRINFIKKPFYIMIGIVYFPIVMYLLYFYMINFICFVFGDCV